MSDVKAKRRKVMIVIEENGTHDGKGFNCYMSGDIERLGKTDQKDLSPAEYYGSQLFKICTQALTQSGAVDNVKKNDTKKN